MSDGEIFMHYFTIQYLIGAMICGIVHPFYKAYDTWYENRGHSAHQYRTMKHYLTYGHIMFGLLLAVIPVVNICVVLDNVWSILMIAIKDLDKKSVFKERPRGR